MTTALEKVRTFTLPFPWDRPTPAVESAASAHSAIDLVRPDDGGEFGLDDVPEGTATFQLTRLRGWRVPKPTPEVRQRFRELARQWQEETEHLSSASQIANHPAYREIIRMGEKAVPLLLAELQRKPNHWFVALHNITGADPVPAESAGKLKPMARAWLEWGRAEGYVE